MTEAIIITPVKDSLETIKSTIESIYKSTCHFEYYIFNDYSNLETKLFLEDAKNKYGFKLVNLEDLTSSPSPNYKLVLEMGQKLALKEKLPLIIIESDVIVEPNTIRELIKIQNSKPNAGVIGAITTDESGNYNFPYNFESFKSNTILNTSNSLSFCCTLLTYNYLNKYNFENLPQNKDWFDVYISKTSRKLGFNNYLAKEIEVLHMPHSSRPWKNQKYSNPILYYFNKYFYKRDRI